MNQAEEIVREYLDAAPRRDFDKIRQLFHEEYSYSGADGERRDGADAGIAVVEMYSRAFPDLALEIQRTHVVDDVVVTEFIARGTHKGRLMDLEPTGRKVEVPVCNVIEVRDGKIYAEREYLDSAYLMRQLDVDA